MRAKYFRCGKGRPLLSLQMRCAGWLCASKPIYFPYLLRYCAALRHDACPALPPAHVFYGCPSHCWLLRTTDDPLSSLPITLTQFRTKLCYNNLVGLARLELAIFRLSVERINQLCYSPKIILHFLRFVNGGTEGNRTPSRCVTSIHSNR